MSKEDNNWGYFPEKNPIQLWDNAPLFNEEIDQHQPTITPYIIDDDKKHGCVIVFPGGGYTMKAYHEGEPIALWLNSIGINSFVLDYRVMPYDFPCPVLDAQRAIRWVRANANSYGIYEDKIGVLGFSAGGHLASVVGTRFDNGMDNPTDDIDKVSCKPNTAVLCYAAIYMEDFVEEGAKVEGPMPPKLSVPSDAPEMFLWHTANDDVVPVGQSLRMVRALKDKGINSELHVYPDGRHGLGLAEGHDTGRWVDECEVFLKNRGF